MSTYGPRLELDLPSGSDKAQLILDAAGIEERRTYDYYTDDVPVDLRATVMRVLHDHVGDPVEVGELVKIRYSVARVVVTFVIKE